MIKRNFTKNKCLKLTAAFLFPFALFSGGMALSQNKAAAEENVEYAYSHHQPVTLTNSNFKQGGSTYQKGDSLTGWSAIETDSKATGMLIDVGSGENTDENSDETTTFANNKDNYMLINNPGSNGPSNDTRILMINSKEKLSQKNVPAYKGYRSSTVALEKNSYYRFSVSAFAMLNGDEYARASIYLNGIKNSDGEDVELGYETITHESTSWKEYFFFVATGDEAQTVTLDLYLGTKSAERSEGAVFFDNANVVRYSENEFYQLCKNFKYDNHDVVDGFNNETVFLVDGLKTKPNLVEGTENINFDFEDEIEPNSYTLGKYWTLDASDKSNANARIVNICDMQPVDFKKMTGYGYVGNDFSNDNSQALVLWTNNNESNSSYVGVKSSDISIKAHNVYKVTLKMKSAGIESGSFYVKVTENDAIYDLYPTLISNDKEAKNYYELASQKTSGISSNVDNDWVNDYQTIEFYIKGHSVYNSFVNLEFWLGDPSTKAQGCVVVDNVQVEYANYSDFSSASNKLELTSFKGSPSNINNPYFNNAEIADDNKYPLTASNWTAVKGEEDFNESGIVYVGSEEEYNDLYVGKYDWAGIRPVLNKESSMANNVYMMFNSKDSYQSVTSTAYSLSTENDYYLLSFDYYNQNYSNLTDSSIKVEVIDENEIVLFSQSGISKLDAWNTMKVYFHLPKTVSHKVQVKVSLGEEKNKVGGIVYLDNFDISVSDSTAFENGVYKSDVTDYYLNLSKDGQVGSEVTESPAYSFDITDESALGGIVSGQNNVYGVTSDSNLLVITNRQAITSTLTSKYKVGMAADKYYVLTFDLKTIFGEITNTEGHDCKYGVSIKLDGYEAITGLVNAEELKEYKVYFKSNSASTPAIAFSLVSDCEETLGTALLTNLDFAESTSEVYNAVSNNSNFNKTVFTAQPTEAQEPEEDDKTEDDKNDTAKENNGLGNSLILASSLIMGIALIVAILGVVFRKVKIKKIDKVRKENYDRKLSVNHDVILTEAQRRRDKEVVELQKAKSVLETEKANMEEQHKVYVRESRQANGKLSRDVEKNFKKYNSDLARTNEKINIVKEKIDYVMSAEYLLSIQRKIMAEEEDRLAKERKARKEALKAKIDEE